MRALGLVVLLAGASAGAEFMGKSSRPLPSSADAALCLGLGQTRDRLRGAFGRGSDFPDQVGAAFEGQGSGEATAGSYLQRGQDLYQQVANVEAQCRAVLGPGSGARSEAEAAAVRRRVQGTKRAADLYLNLPLTIANMDSRGDAAALVQRPQLLTAMYKIADGGNYEAAGAIAGAAQAALDRLRR